MDKMRKEWKVIFCINNLRGNLVGLVIRLRIERPRNAWFYARLGKAFWPNLRRKTPPVQWTPGFFPNVKRPRLKVDQQSPSNVEAKKQLLYTPTTT